ncbi:ribonuclease III [Tessaracoccus sp. OS52]|uniref:ribonuclease III n=1 Tax=Tessaracoccus sp. OS52 TaxID=2886691 RepID=UPI001D121C63|nr:ribonuclease III [Tessaracoccus sp. OS52]
MSRLEGQLAELGVQVDAQLFELACTHRSYAYEHGGIPSNERLEFLGDAVLQIVVTEHIFNAYPDLAEGELAKLRASVVSTYALADVARGLELGPLILLGKGEIATGGSDKSSILADTTEAIIGAVHLSGGPEASARFVHALLDERIADSQAEGEYADFKTTLQELSARNGWGLPVYEVEGSGPDHQRTYTATVVVGGQARGTGTAPSKKLAEQRAATVAFRALGGGDA